ncbi:MAG: hypothetical protein QME92_12945 [Bacillota bacterium]|nr:hypothetical protein [Bacillota bacterium]
MWLTALPCTPPFPAALDDKTVDPDGAPNFQEARSSWQRFFVSAGGFPTPGRMHSETFSRGTRLKACRRGLSSDHKEHVTRFFIRFLDACNLATLRLRVLAYMVEDAAPATFNLRREYLKAFFGRCVREGALPENPPATPLPTYRSKGTPALCGTWMNRLPPALIV